MERLAMTSDEAKDVIELIVSCYPKYVEKKNEHDNPKRRIQVLHQKLLKRDYKKTLRKVNNYIDSSPYEPSFSDILPAKENERLSVKDQLRQGGVNI